MGASDIAYPPDKNGKPNPATMSLPQPPATRRWYPSEMAYPDHPGTEVPIERPQDSHDYGPDK